MNLIRLESDYILISNKKKFAEIYNRENITKEDIIDAYISLHLVLEVGINTLLRHLTLTSFKKSIHPIEVIRNLDKINFIDKVVSFIYNSKFNFNEDLEQATEYYKVIGRLRDFSGVRNKLLHGHSISTIQVNGETYDSDSKQLLTKKALDNQVDKFIFIMNALGFYLEHLD